MFIFTRDLETKRFKAVAGMPVPPKYNTKWARADICARYGKDLIKEVPQAYQEQGAEQMAKIYSGVASEQIKKLEAANVALVKENDDLRAKLKKKTGAAPDGGAGS